jgi:hypothetical protein
MLRHLPTRRLRPESRYGKPRDALPIELCGAGLEIKEYPAKDIALFWGECVIAKYRRRCVAPRDEIPRYRLHKGWTALQGIEHVLNARRNTFLRLIADHPMNSQKYRESQPTDRALPGGACDCHAHVYGPFDQFPLAARTPFQPPLAPVEALEKLWGAFGVERGVLRILNMMQGFSLWRCLLWVSGPQPSTTIAGSAQPMANKFTNDCLAKRPCLRDARHPQPDPWQKMCP